MQNPTLPGWLVMLATVGVTEFTALQSPSLPWWENDLLVVAGAACAYVAHLTQPRKS